MTLFGQSVCGAGDRVTPLFSLRETMSTCNPTQPEAFGQADAFKRPREFLNNEYVYAVVSARANGLSIGVNISPTGDCSFDCVYCEVDHSRHCSKNRIDFDTMASELEQMLAFTRSGEIRKHPSFAKLPADLTVLRHVAISGNGEPTLSPQFSAAVETVMHVRARSRQFYKVVLITNGTGLHLPEVQLGLRCFTSEDEVWVKLDAGTPEYAQQINRSKIPFEKTVENILQLAKRRSVTIQSLFPSINGKEPPREEIQEYANRLADLKGAGAQIQLVQIYSADRPCRRSGISHLPLKTLSGIARTVRETAGLRAEVF